MIPDTRAIKTTVPAIAIPTIAPVESFFAVDVGVGVGVVDEAEVGLGMDRVGVRVGMSAFLEK